MFKVRFPEQDSSQIDLNYAPMEEAVDGSLVDTLTDSIGRSDEQAKDALPDPEGPSVEPAENPKS